MTAPRAPRSASPAGIAGWLLFDWAQQPFFTLAERITAFRPLADDSHFGVREWAWLALRPALMADTEAALTALTPLTAEPSPNLRRFASEATRPRGVWCAHWPELKADPQRALPLLEPLRADASRYVQDSVANWLNDAAKSEPRFVLDTNARWQRESKAASTAYIVKRARRSLTD